MAGAWLAALIALSGISIKWTPFHSQTYPYKISQPSSYVHRVIKDTAGTKVDYFFPAPLGSFLTNVNIFANSDKVTAAQSLQLLHGRHLRCTTWIRIMGQQRPLYEADFVSAVGHFTLGKVVIVIGARVWHLTISYEPRYRSQRPIMLKMLRTFKGR